MQWGMMQSPATIVSCENWSVNSGIIPSLKEKFTAAVRRRGSGLSYVLCLGLGTCWVVKCQVWPSLSFLGLLLSVCCPL